MSTLQVSNVHFESSGNNRLQYTGSNSFNLVAGGSTVASINTTAIDFPLNATVEDLVANVATTTTVAANTVAANAVTSNSFATTGGVVVIDSAADINATSVSVGGTEVVNSSAGLTNISAIDATTANTITNSLSLGGNMPTINVFTSNATYTKPADLVGVKVTVIGGGGKGYGAAQGSGPKDSPTPEFSRFATGGSGGGAIKYIPAPSITGPVAITVGDAGTPLNPGAGGTSSFGAFASATGGSAGNYPVNPTPGTGTGGDINTDGGGQRYVSGYSSSTKLEAWRPFGSYYGGGGDASPGTPSGIQGVVIVEEFY